MTQGIGSSSEYKALLNQMQGVFGQLSSMGVIKGGTYINTIWGAAGDVEALVTGNDTQKASAIQSLINKALSLVEKFGNQEASRARKEVQEGKKDAEKLVEEQEKSLADLNQSLEDIGSDIDNQRSIVDTANGTLDVSQQELEEKQELINEIIEQIQEKQQELAAATDPEVQKALLSEIQGLSGQIAAVVAEVQTIQENIQAAAEEVEAAVIDIETAKGNAVEVQEDGTLKVTELAEQGANNIAATTQTQATGVQNGVTAKVLEAQASASNFVPGVGTAASVQLTQTAVDQEMAAGARTTGALGNLRTIMQGIGGLNDNLALLTTFQNAIGSALESFNGCVGDYNTKIESVITSVGSFLGEGGVTASTSTLDAAVAADMQAIDARLSEDESAEVSDEESEESDANEDNLSGLLTPDVELINPFEIA